MWVNFLARPLTVSAMLLCAGCGATITPPSHVDDPVTVYVADYGRHSSIILPTGGPNLIEYTYGDWELYAQNKYKWYIGFTKLLLTEKAALGRRSIGDLENEQHLRMRVWAKRLVRIEVEKSKAAALLHDLEQVFDGRIDTMIHNAPVDTYFVRHDSTYWLMNNCNQLTAAMAAAIGLRSEWMHGDFAVQRPPPGSNDPGMILTRRPSILSRFSAKSRMACG